jgi:hypothetical protein
VGVVVGGRGGGAEEGALGVQTFPPEELLLGREEGLLGQLGIAHRVHPLQRCGEGRFTYCTGPRSIPISYIPLARRGSLRDHLLRLWWGPSSGGTNAQEVET